MDVKKSPTVPPFTFFGTMGLLRNLIFNISKGFPFIFLIFCNRKNVKKCQMVPFLARQLDRLGFSKVIRNFFVFHKRPEHILKSSRFLSLRYSAELRRSRLASIFSRQISKNNFNFFNFARRSQPIFTKNIPFSVLQFS